MDTRSEQRELGDTASVDIDELAASMDGMVLDGEAAGESQNQELGPLHLSLRVRWKPEHVEISQGAIYNDALVARYLRLIRDDKTAEDWSTVVKQHLATLDLIGTEPMIVQDACLGDLTQTTYFHFEHQVIYAQKPLLLVAGELRIKHNVDVKWLALCQIGQQLIRDAAIQHSLEPTYGGPSRTGDELMARIRVHQVKATAWDAFCWRYESAENMAQVSAEKDHHDAKFGAGTWSGESLEFFFQPFFEEGDVQGFPHAQPFYREVFAAQVELNNMMDGMKLNSRAD